MEEINGSMWLEPRSPRKRYMRWVQGIKPSASLSLLCSRLPGSGTWPVSGVCIGQALTLKIGVAVPQLKPSACPVLAVCAAVSPHLYTLSYIQPFSHTCTHTYSRFHTPVHTVIHTAVSPHLYTLSYIQPFPHTCTHCHTYSCFPTPVHTVIHTAVSPHLYTLSYIHTYSPTAVSPRLYLYNIIHASTVLPALLPVGFQQWSLSYESYCRSEQSGHGLLNVTYIWLWAQPSVYGQTIRWHFASAPTFCPFCAVAPTLSGHIQCYTHSLSLSLSVCVCLIPMLCSRDHEMPPGFPNVGWQTWV